MDMEDDVRREELLQQIERNREAVKAIPPEVLKAYQQELDAIMKRWS